MHNAMFASAIAFGMIGIGLAYYPLLKLYIDLMAMQHAWRLRRWKMQMLRLRRELELATLKGEDTTLLEEKYERIADQ